MSKTFPTFATMRDTCTALAGDAARAILRIYAGDRERTRRQEPVTMPTMQPS